MRGLGKLGQVYSYDLDWMAFINSGVWFRPNLNRKKQIAVANYLAESKPEELDADVALQVKDLSLAWSSGRPVLKGISFSVPKGQVCMVVGPNGCGKSTLLRALHGLTYADSGKINIRSPVGFVFQDPSVQVSERTSISGRIRQCMLTRMQFSRRQADAIPDCVHGGYVWYR